MKKAISVFLAILLIVLNFATIGSIMASADSAIIMLSSPTVKVGEEIDVTVKYTATASMTKVAGTIKYDDKILSYVSGATSCANSVVNINEDVSLDKVKSYTVKFKAIAVGASSIDFSMNATKQTSDGNAAAGASVSVTGDAVAASGVTGITLSVGELTPAFSPEITEYSATVPFDTQRITIAATAGADTKLSGIGLYRLNVGENRKAFSATLNGQKTTYSIIIKRLNEEETKAQVEIDAAKQASTTGILIDEKSYHIETDLSKKNIPSGFSQETAKYKDVDVNVITDQNKKYTLYLLATDDNSELDWYYLDESGNFKKLLYIVSNNVTYIIESPKSAYENGSKWYTASANINDIDVTVYKSTNVNLKDIYVVLCYVNGKNGYYRYDTIDNTLQRAPDFIEPSVRELKESLKSGNVIKNFAYLSNTGKILVSLSLLETLCIIAIIVVLVRKYIIRMKEYKLMQKKLELEEQENTEE